MIVPKFLYSKGLAAPSIEGEGRDELGDLLKASFSKQMFFSYVIYLSGAVMVVERLIEF